MHALGIIIFCLAVVHPFLCNGEENADVDPILEHLRMNPANVIEHELIHINVSHNLHKRAIFGEHQDPRGSAMRFRAFGGDINLWLYPRDSLFASAETPVFFVYEDNTRVGVRYVLQKDAMKKVGRLFEDPKHYASMVIGSDPTSDRPQITGNMRSRRDNSALVIRPLPEEVVEKHLRRRRSIHGPEYDRAMDSARHVVLKVKDYFPNFDFGEDFKKRINVRGNSAAPSTSVNANNNNVDYSHSIYPKMFVELDSTYWSQGSLTGKNEESAMTTLLEYVLAFWNGVDLSYRHLENPNFRFHISGIAMAKSPRATPFISTSRRSPNSPVDPDAAIEKAKTFFFSVREQIPLDSYNVAVTMTLLNLQAPTIGIAAVGAVCLDQSYWGRKDGVALVHDDGAFGGIDTAVHEIGHSFGLHHDDGNKAAACDNSHGFIMGSVTNPTENTSMFSPCSLAQFNAVLKQGGLKCMYNPPKQKAKNLPKPMPGKILSLSDQCRMLNYQNVCSYGNEDPCVRLTCTSKIVDNGRTSTEYCQPLTHGAAPGTPCNAENDETPRFCIQRRCVAVN